LSNSFRTKDPKGFLTVDRNLPVLRRNELKSCKILKVEQTYPL